MIRAVHPTLQLIRKDFERLRWPLLLTLVLLAVWTVQQAGRTATVGPVPIPQTTWLDACLPLAWCLLTALIIQQDPLTGDRQFWATLPCGWRPLLAAKAAFIVGSIEVPYFIACAAIVLAQGFNPVQHVPHLLWKQLVLLALILPATAAATVAKNMAQYLLLLVVAASGVVFLSGRFNLGENYRIPGDTRWALTLIILAAGAISVALLQFARRCTVRSRVIGILTALAAAGVYNYLTRDASAAIYAAFHPVSATVTRLAISPGSQQPDFSTQQRYYMPRRTSALISLDVAGLSAEPDARLEQVSLRLTAASGERYEAEWRTSPNAIKDDQIVADIFHNKSAGTVWQALEFSNPAVWNRLRAGPVTIEGRALATYYRQGASFTMRPGDRHDIGDAVHCRADATPGEPTLRTVYNGAQCASLETAPGDISVGMQHEGFVSPFGTLSEHRFFGLSQYPQDPWLSPVRRAAFFVSGAPRVITLVLTVLRPAGSTVIDYTIPDVDLNRFVVQEPVRQGAPQ